MLLLLNLIKNTIKWKSGFCVFTGTNAFKVKNFLKLKIKIQKIYFPSFRDEFYSIQFPIFIKFEFLEVCLFIFLYIEKPVSSHKRRNISLLILVYKFIKKIQFSAWRKQKTNKRQIKKKSNKKEIMRDFCRSWLFIKKALEIY